MSTVSIKEEFDKWFNEVVTFATRSEYFHDDLLNASHQPETMEKWLKAAYEAGMRNCDKIAPNWSITFEE